MAEIDFGTHGQELLHGSKYSASEVARLVGCARQRVSDWRRGLARPDGDARQAIASKLGIPATSWDAPPVLGGKVAPSRQVAPGEAGGTSKVPVAVEPPIDAQGGPRDVAVVASMSDELLEAMGLPGIEATIRRIRGMHGDLPPREAVSAAVAEGRLHDRLVVLRQRDANARREYLDGEEFREDVALLRSAFPESAAALRSGLQRFGIELAKPIAAVEDIDGAPPHSPEDIEDLLGELATAAEFTAAGESGLAAGHILGLAIDRHADAIATIIADRPELAARLLGLLPVEGPDHRVVRAALERRVAVRAVAALPPDARKAVSALLDVLDLADLSREIGA